MSDRVQHSPDINEPGYGPPQTSSRSFFCYNPGLIQQTVIDAYLSVPLSSLETIPTVLREGNTV